MGFWNKLFGGGESPAPQPETAAKPEEKLGSNEAENVFFGEKTPTMEAFEAQRAEEAQRAADMKKAADARNEAIMAESPVAAELPVTADEDTEEVEANNG